MKTLPIVLLLLIGCGKKNETCFSKDQALALCIAEGIRIRPNPVQLDSVERDCGTFYQAEYCYEKKGKFFPYDR